MNLTTDAQLNMTIPLLLEYSRGAADFIFDEENQQDHVDHFLRELAMPEGCALDYNLMEGVKWLESMYANGVNGILMDDDLG